MSLAGRVILNHFTAMRRFLGWGPESHGGSPRACSARRAELVAGVAHDLAHPLTAMRGTLEALRDGLIVSSDAGVTARLLTDVSTMGETIEDLRDVAAAEAGRLRLEFRDVDVSAIVTDCARSWLTRLDRRANGGRRLTRIVARLD